MNINKRLGLFGILGILQDVATIHGNLMGVGLEKMIEENAFWVLIQQQLKMSKWPVWQDVITINTWAREFDGLKAYRDFEIYRGTEKIGECVATFMVLDGETRKPVRPNLGENFDKLCHKEGLNFTPTRISIQDEVKLSKTIEVRNSDLDMNIHVNNTKYAQWILDSIPLEYHKTHKLLDFSINFLAETHLGDKIDIYYQEEKRADTELKSTYFHGVRESDNRPVFTATMLSKHV